MADLLGRLDEGAADIVVADDPQFERQRRFLGIAERRRHARIGNRDDDVRIDMAFPGELAADPLARFIDAAAFDDAVGPREIDVLEDAKPALAVAERGQALDTAAADDDDLAGGD